jgi:hypothetical protein
MIQLQVKISQLPGTRGCMLAGVMFGLDKTTVSVGTGDVEFHPVYASLTNIKNRMCRAHRDALVPIALLAIPKSMCCLTSPHRFSELISAAAFLEHGTSDAFLRFRKQLYHTCLAHILKPLCEYMEKPDVALCPDGHYRKVIYSIGPWTADYPEQVWLSGIVQNWCPKFVVSAWRSLHMLIFIADVMLSHPNSNAKDTCDCKNIVNVYWRSLTRNNCGTCLASTTKSK